MGISSSALPRTTCPRRLSGAAVASDVSEDVDNDLPPLEEVGPEQLLNDARTMGTCMVCFDEGIMLQLDCRHEICGQCLGTQLSTGYSGPRLTFSYLNCGICRAPLSHGSIREELARHGELRDQALQVAVWQFCADGLRGELCRALDREVSDSEVQTRAEAEMAVYRCHDCSEPFCAGRVDCIQAAGAEEECIDPKRLRCSACRWSDPLASQHRCLQHGHRFAIFKCNSCCDVAVWTCSSNHYCDRCHNEASIKKDYPCLGPGLCQLCRPHPPNAPAVIGDHVPEFILGCTACLGCADANEEPGPALSEYGDIFDFEDDYSDADDDLTPLTAKWGRECTLATSRLRATARRARAAAKAERLARNSQARRARGGQRLRGGRHKVPAVPWFDACHADVTA